MVSSSAASVFRYTRVPAMAVRLGHQDARQKSLIAQDRVAEECRSRIRLHHQVQRQPPPLENGGSVAAAHAADLGAVPHAGQRRGGLQAMILAHAITADELAALGREDAERRRGIYPYLDQALDRRLCCGEERLQWLAGASARAWSVGSRARSARSSCYSRSSCARQPMPRV